MEIDVLIEKAEYMASQWNGKTIYGEEDAEIALQIKDISSELRKALITLLERD